MTAPASGVSMSAEMVERVANALEQADVRYRMELTRLVDGESTYTLTYGDGRMFEFPDTDEVYAHVRRTKREVAARAALSAIPLDRVVQVLTEDAETFERYASIHAAKGTEDGRAKAESNAALAARRRALIADLEGRRA